MVFTRYSNLAAQQSEHHKLLDSLERRVSGYKIAPERGEALSDFLYDWFVNHHTQVEDRKIAEHIRHSEMHHPTESPNS